MSNSVRGGDGKGVRIIALLFAFVAFAHSHYTSAVADTVERTIPDTTLSSQQLVQQAPAETVRLRIELPPPGRLPWVVFDERSGLPQHTIVDLMTDHQGFVWAATQDGLARYNGRSWQPIPLPRRMGSNYPRAMRAAKDGGIWIGSFDGGLAYLRDGRWTIRDIKSGLPSNRIRGLLETTDSQGHTGLWIAGDRGVAHLQDGKLSTYKENSGLPSLDTEALCETVANGERTVLVGTSYGLARFERDHFVPVPVPKQILNHRIGDIVESVGLHGGPALWITSYGAGMAVLENGTWTILDTNSGLPSNVEVLTKSTASDRSEALWIGTEGGLLRFEHGRFTLYDERCGLPVRIIWKVLETTSPGGLKTIWLGTWGGGIERYSPNHWTAFDTTMGMPAGSVTSALITRDDHGIERILAGTSDGDLAISDNGRFQRVDLPEALQHSIVFSLLETKEQDSHRSIWVGSFGGGLGRLRDGKWTVYGPEVLPNERVYTVVETKSETGQSVLWVGTEGGLGRFENGKWSHYDARSGQLPSEIVTQVLETQRADGKKTLWVGTSKGIARFESGRWTTIGKRSGLLSENIVALESVTDANGVRWIWAGTFAGGASRMRLDDPSAKWESFTTTSNPRLPGDTVMSIAQDGLHRIYLGTTRGIARLTARIPTADNASRFSIDVYTMEDGLPSGDCQQAARLSDQQGRVWFGTARGLAMFDPNSELPDHSPKPLVIESAHLSENGHEVHLGDVLSHTERNLSFEAALLAYGSESRIQYRYQLVGFDPQPSSWTPNAAKEYTNLGAGKYEFRIWGRDAHGNISGPATLAFRIKPAPWFTTWALAAYGLLLLSILYAGMHWRVRVLSRRTKQLEIAVAERTKELSAARDKLEQLASQDGLTQLANRRRFDAVLEEEWKRAQRSHQWLSLALLDVDFFKRYNDRYGHAQGDTCLRAVAQATALQCKRITDLVARYGGEEFALVLPETDPEGARALLKSILNAVDALQIEHADSDCASHVTVSLGAISLKPALDSESISAMKIADQMLYRSKEFGRHQAAHDNGSGSAQQIHPDETSALRR